MSVDLNKGATVELVKTLSDDIRLGADGVTYTSAGAAVREQVEKLHDVTNDQFTFDATDWAIGTLNPNSGTEGVSTTRARSPYIEVKKGDVAKYAGNANCLIIYAYDANKGYVLDTAWTIGNTYTIALDTIKYIRVLLRKDSSNSTVSSSDVSGMVANFAVYRNLPQDVYFINHTNDEVTYLKSIFDMDDPVFTDGYWVNYNDGSFTANDGYKYATADVSLFRGGKIKGTTGCPPHAQPTDGTYGMAFYDEFDTYISGDYSTRAGSYQYDYNVTVPANASKVRISLRIASASLWTGITYPWDVVFENLQKRLDEDEKSENDVVYKNRYARHVAEGSVEPLTFLHFSDLHADKKALGRIMEAAAKYGDEIDEMICTGDMVSNTYGEIASWWDERVLTCIGNHDTASYNAGTGYNWTALSMANRDQYYIAPFESNWGVIHTSGTSYYYKDYSDQKVRLIVMDGMLYNDNGAEATAQTSWLSELLSDAISSNLHVLIAIHSPHAGATAESCSFSRYGQGAMPVLSDCNTPQSVIDAVATAITGGLKFIGYIVGHTHQDNIWDAENDGKQLMYCVTCANTVYKPQWTKSDQDRTDTDAYNLVTIDTAHTLIKLVRGGGANIDDHMRTRKAICFDYSTGEKVGEVL